MAASPTWRGGKRGVVHRPTLVDVAVDVARIDVVVAQLQQVEQHAVVLVDRRRARVDGHLGVGLDTRHDVGGQDVRGEEVVERAVGVADGHAAAGRAGALYPAHQGHDVGLVDRHPAAAVRGEGRDDPGHVAGEDVG